MAEHSHPEEPEIINPGGKHQVNSRYRAKYTEYTEQTRQASPAVFVLSLIAFCLSLIPVIGVCLAIIAMVFAKIKNTSMILAVIAFVVGCVSTIIFLLIAMVLKWIF